MAGLRKPHFQLIALILSLIVLSSSIVAQSNNSRIERAIVENQSATIYVSIPRGRTIDAAELVSNEGIISLDASPVPSDVTLWILLDQSEAVINSAPAIQTGVTRFLDGFGDETQIGILLYNHSIDYYVPTNNHNEMLVWLSSYSGRANTPNCIYQALNDVQNEISQRGGVHRILLIGGNPMRQSLCDDVDMNFHVPIDMLIVSDNLDTLYEDIGDASGGRIWRANLQVIANRLDEVKSLWSNPIYEVSGSIAGNLDGHTLELSLSDDSSLSLSVEFELVEGETAAEESSNGLSSLGDLVTQPATTEAETPATPIPTNDTSAVITNPTQMPTQSEEVATSAPEIEATSLPDENPDVSESDVNNNTDNQDIQETVPDVGTPEDAAVTQDLSTLVLIGGGSAAVLLILVIILMMRRKSPAQAPNRPVEVNNSPQISAETIIEMNSHAETIIEMTQVEIADELDMTEMFDEPEDEAVGEIDMFEVTEIVTEEDLLKTKSHVVARLHNPKTGDYYDICRPDTTLGRKDSCDIVIHDDKVISREHLRFLVEGEDEIVVIINTQNPVLLNDKRMDNRSRIQEGDVLTLSKDTELTLVSKQQGEELL